LDMHQLKDSSVHQWQQTESKLRTKQITFATAVRKENQDANHFLMNGKQD